MPANKVNQLTYRNLCSLAEVICENIYMLSHYFAYGKDIF
jgi:hypothetical protein